MYNETLRCVHATIAAVEKQQVLNIIISTRTKLRIFPSNVKSVLLYGSETWKVSKTTTSKLQTFVNHCLRKIFNIYWPEVISDEELWRRAEEIEISVQIKRRKWNWTGHTRVISKEMHTLATPPN